MYCRFQKSSRLWSTLSHLSQKEKLVESIIVCLTQQRWRAILIWMRNNKIIQMLLLMVKGNTSGVDKCDERWYLLRRRTWPWYWWDALPNHKCLTSNTNITQCQHLSPPEREDIRGTNEKQPSFQLDWSRFQSVSQRKRLTTCQRQASLELHAYPGIHIIWKCLNSGWNNTNSFSPYQVDENNLVQVLEVMSTKDKKLPV